MWDDLKGGFKSTAIQVISVMLLIGIGLYRLYDYSITDDSQTEVERSVASDTDTDDPTEWYDDGNRGVNNRGPQQQQDQVNLDGTKIFSQKISEAETPDENKYVVAVRSVASSNTGSGINHEMGRDQNYRSGNTKPVPYIVDDSSNPSSDLTSDESQEDVTEETSEVTPEELVTPEPTAAPLEVVVAPPPEPTSTPVPIPTAVPPVPTPAPPPPVMGGDITVDIDYCNKSWINNPFIELSSDVGETIYYCLQDNICCDPQLGSGSELDLGTYADVPLEITNGNGDYCLSVQAVTGSDEGDVVECQIQVNNVEHISLTASTELQLQTNEVVDFAIQSDNFGKRDYLFYQINMGVNDPGAGPYSSVDCQTMKDNYAPDTFGMRYPASDGDLSVDISPLDPVTDQLLVSVGKYNNMTYGLNWLLSLIEYNAVDGLSYACDAAQITIKDFEIFYSIFVGQIFSTPNASGISVFHGNFESYGHFDSGSVVGSGTNNQNDVVLEHGLINIIN